MLVEIFAKVLSLMFLNACFWVKIIVICLMVNALRFLKTRLENKIGKNLRKLYNSHVTEYLIINTIRQ